MSYISPQPEQSDGGEIEMITNLYLLGTPGAGYAIVKTGATSFANISITPDLSGYVPYTGATTNVDLGTHTLTAGTATLYGDNVNNDQYGLGLGYNTVVSGINSIAIGTNSVADASSTIAIGGGSAGNGPTATGADSIAIGSGHPQQSRSGAYAGVEGIAIGSGSYTTGIGVAIGVDAKDTSGGYSVAIGYGAETSDIFSFALGYGAKASGVSSFAALGLASNEGTITIGGVSSGLYSMSFGYSSVASNDNQIVFANQDFTYGTDNGNYAYTQLDIYNGLANFQGNSIQGASFIKNGGTSSQFLKADGSVDSSTYLTTTPAQYGKKQITVSFDGQGTPPIANSKAYIRVPVAGTITGWKIFGDISGSAVVDVWKDTYANYPPLVADSIAGTEKPTLSSVIKNEDTSLSTWTTAVSEGDILVFNLDSASTLTKVWLALTITI